MSSPAINRANVNTPPGEGDDEPHAPLATPQKALETEEWNPVGVSMTPNEYLARERVAAGKSEYRDGQAFTMAGASETHITLTGNLFALLWQRLRGGRCRIYANEMRVLFDETAHLFYPDIVIVCGERLFHDNRNDTITNPSVIVEVLSPSTERFDRGEKFREYQKIASLREYVLVSQTTQAVERYVRQSDSNLWMYALTTGESAVARFETLETDVPLADIYEGANV